MSEDVCLLENIPLDRRLTDLPSPQQTRKGFRMSAMIQNLLFEACVDGSWTDVLFLVGCGGRLNQRDSRGDTTLHIAVLGNNVNVARELLEGEPGRRGMDVDEMGREGETPLIYACGYGHLPMVNLLLEWNADINMADDDGNTALHVAVLYGNDPVVERLVTSEYLDINVVNDSDQTPLLIACSRNFPRIVQMLLDKGADVNEMGLLHHGVLYFSREVIDLLFQRNPYLDLADDLDRTPLHYACKFGREENAHKLIRRGACLNTVDYLGRSPLLVAAEFGHRNLVRQLLRAGAKANANGAQGTSMSEEEFTDHCKVLDIICEPGCEVSTASSYLEDLCQRRKHDVFLKLFNDHFSNKLRSRGFCTLLFSSLASQTSMIIAQLHSSVYTAVISGLPTVVLPTVYGHLVNTF